MVSLVHSNEENRRTFQTVITTTCAESFVIAANYSAPEAEA